MGQRLLKPTNVNHSWIRPPFHTPSSRDHESVKLCTCGILAKHGKPSPPQVNSFFGVACKSSNFHRAEGSRFSPIALFGSPMFPVERLQHAAPHLLQDTHFERLPMQPFCGTHEAVAQDPPGLGRPPSLKARRRADAWHCHSRRNHGSGDKHGDQEKKRARQNSRCCNTEREAPMEAATSRV